jgi:hypothetical protein
MSHSCAHEQDNIARRPVLERDGASIRRDGVRPDLTELLIAIVEVAEVADLFEAARQKLYLTRHQPESGAELSTLFPEMRASSRLLGGMQGIRVGC